jgi:hypothetical protein
MGYDISGRRPTNAEGEYFRANIFDWPPVAQLIIDLCPQEAQAVGRGLFFNEGGGLDADDTAKLVARLRRLIADGSVAAYCRGPRKRNPGDAIADAMSSRFPDAVTAPQQQNPIETLERFLRFAAASGGFVIC